MGKDMTFIIKANYSMLVGREIGAKVLEECCGYLASCPAGTVVAVSFKNVKFLDFSAGDEFIRKAINRVLGKEYQDIFIYFTDIQDIIMENIEAVLKLNGQTAIVQGPALPARLLGIINQQLKDTWDMVNRKKTLTARELADAMNLAINTSSNRLAKLYSLRLIRQSQKKGAKGGGQEYTYESIV